jgi:hypothetical protein
MIIEPTKSNIESLEKSWRPRESNNYPWHPFGDDWSISDGRINPIDIISAVRQQPIHEDITPLLNDQCREILSGIWSGHANDHLSGDGDKPHDINNLDLRHFHCYRFDKPKHPRWDTWRKHIDYSQITPDVWWCKNLQDAAEKYSWHSSGLGSFESLSLALQNAVGLGDEARVAAICFVILQWGSVKSLGGKKLSSFENWIFDRASNGDLSKCLIDATSQLIPQSTSSLDDFDGHRYYMNSSSTKIYAALAMDLSLGIDNPSQDVLIYDGRVAGAIGLIVRHILSCTGKNSIPKELCFPIDNRKKRNPNCKGFKYQSFIYSASGHKQRAKFAQIASRYIQEFLQIYTPSHEFVVAERGLFMIGYNVSAKCDRTSRCI